MLKNQNQKTVSKNQTKPNNKKPPLPNQTSYTLNIHKSKQNYVHTHTHIQYSHIKNVEPSKILKQSFLFP